jgi:dihydroorotate dehydrogenase electron transfer subunit
LRRPFSIFDARDGRVTLLYKTVGRGTSALASVREGDSISVLGPLGRGFPAKCSGTALLVGGGYGVAPLYFLARTLDCPKILFVGGRTAADVLAYDDFKEIGTDVRVATNDGSLGEKGFVTIPLDAETKRLADAGERFEFFTCGPDGLLKAVADRALSFGVPGWISMDRHMICGVGACYACIQKTVRGNSRCCIEGPVFPAEDLVWQ